MNKYEEEKIRLTRMHDPKWVKMIGEIKTLECSDKNKDYYVLYKKDKQKKERKYCFDKVQYVEETKSFIFTQFKRNPMDCSEILDAVDSTEILLDIEIDGYEIKDKPDYCISCTVW